MGGRNHAQDTLESRFVGRLAALEKQVLALSTPQPIGGDNLEIIVTNSILAGPITLPFNASFLLNQPCNPGASLVSVWNYAVTIYVDTLDHQHTWPQAADGTGVLTPEQQNYITVSQWLDYEDSNDTTGIRMFKTWVLNNDAATHTIWYRMRGFLPKQTGSS